MNYFELLYSAKRISKVADYWTLLVPFILANVLWFSMLDLLKYVLLNTNYTFKYIELNIFMFIYVIILSGVVALFERDIRKALSLPLFFIPYFFLPVYFRILGMLQLPPMLSIAISFTHSVMISAGYYRWTIQIIRTAACIMVMLVVRRWLLVTL
ncbi:hypothetical protein ACSFC1_07490 [Pseudothermotoga sp. U03pept]|uniref:hypothetical protein n=1 Tax=Pseudothermotoga sp. U03pept TaxID=3447012 RepID=UPI003EFC796D